VFSFFGREREADSRKVNFAWSCTPSPVPVQLLPKWSRVTPSQAMHRRVSEPVDSYFRNFYYRSSTVCIVALTCPHADHSCCSSAQNWSYSSSANSFASISGCVAIAKALLTSWIVQNRRFIFRKRIAIAKADILISKVEILSILQGYNHQHDTVWSIAIIARLLR